MDGLNRVGKKLGRPGSAGKVLEFPVSRRRIGSAENQPGEDRVDLSAKARTAGRARAAVEQAADIRTTRIKALKALVRGRRYPIDAHRVAEKLVEEHLSDLT